VTGAIISWDHELDDLLNPHLMEANTPGEQRSPLELARSIELRDARAQVNFIPLSIEPGTSAGFGVIPREDPSTGELYELGYNEVFLDPVTGAELGRREWGGVLADHHREPRLLLICAALLAAHPGDVGHRSLGPVAARWHRDHLDDRLLRRLLSHASRAAARSRNGRALLVATVGPGVARPLVRRQHPAQF
jgi:hypothetical protein